MTCRLISIGQGHGGSFFPADGAGCGPGILHTVMDKCEIASGDDDPVAIPARPAVFVLRAPEWQIQMEAGLVGLHVIRIAQDQDGLGVSPVKRGAYLGVGGPRRFFHAGRIEAQRTEIQPLHHP